MTHVASLHMHRQQPENDIQDTRGPAKREVDYAFYRRGCQECRSIVRLGVCLIIDNGYSKASFARAV